MQVKFTAAVEIFVRMNIEAGINISGVRLSHLRFANDIINEWAYLFHLPTKVPTQTNFECIFGKL